jgi:hypothetical protein
MIKTAHLPNLVIFGINDLFSGLFSIVFIVLICRLPPPVSEHEIAATLSIGVPGVNNPLPSQTY